VPSRDKQSQQDQTKRGFDWPAIMRTFAVEVAVLAALAFAFVGYVNWSSETAVQEFMKAGPASGLDADYQPPSPISVQVIRARAD
jgi:hypothetical protein